MNFILSLAHFCEVHGPTSILCTQVLPPECLTCDSPSSPAHTLDGPILNSKFALPTARQHTEPISSGPNTHSSGSTPRPNTSIRPSTAHLGNPHSSNSSSSLSSPTDTPPASPRSPVLTSSSLPSGGIHHGSGPGNGAASTNGSDTCRNCCLSLPKSIGDKVPGAGTADKGNKMPSPVLRTKEVVPVYAPGDSSHFGPGWQGDVSVDGLQQPIRSKQQSQLGPNSHTDASASHIGNPKPTTHISSRPSKMPARSSSSSSVSSADEDDLLPGVGPIRHPASSVLPPNSSPASLHTHDIVYLSTRAPATPSRFSTLRQSCVRTLSCELLPTHTGPILFGDPLAGYTIAYVFRLADPKARGGRRSYALLCICPDERIIVRSWKYVVRTFEWLVQRINSFAAVKNAHDKTAAAAAAVAKSNLGSTTSPIIGGTGMTGRFGGVTAPEGFLRRREGVGSAKGLAELVGKEDLFLQIHACFAELLGGLGRKFGYWNVVEPQVVLPIKSEKPIGAVGEEEHNWDRSRSVARMGGATGPGRDPKNLLIGNKGGGNGGVTVIQRSHSTDGSLSRGIDVKPLAVGGMA